MAIIKKRKFSIEVEGEVYDGGYLEVPPSSNLPIIDTDLYCNSCGGIWARLKYTLPDQRSHFLFHCKCRNCGGTGLLHPTFLRDNVRLNFPLEILKRDFLICMEKKILWSPGIEMHFTPVPLHFGCHWWPRLNFEWGYLDENEILGNNI